MIIYPKEKHLEERIVASKTTAVCVSVSLSDDKTDLLIESLNKISKDGCDSKLGKAIATLAENKESHPDLMYGSAILVSTVKNKNDDVFLPEETWKARNTPVNTPYNDDHVRTNIIGHIIAARPIDRDGKLIKSEEAPDYFDIEVDFVIYKDIFPEIASEIAKKAPIGEKFVSMEATFTNFDYALFNSDGSVDIVQREEATAFLTKYLRAYGGEGIYKDKTIGRVLRNFRFNGMGNVDSPANPASEYTKINSFRLAANFEDKDNFKVIFLQKGNIMKKYEKLEDAVADLEALHAQVAELQPKAKEFDVLTTKVSDLESKLQAEQSKVQIAQDALTAEAEKSKNAEAELSKAKAELKEKSDELNKIHSEAKVVERTAALEKLGFKVDDAKRKALASWSDEHFNSVVEFAGSLSKKNEDAKASDLNKAKEQDEVDVTKDGGDQTDAGKSIAKAADKLVEIVMARKSDSSKSNKDKKK